MPQQVRFLLEKLSAMITLIMVAYPAAAVGITIRLYNAVYTRRVPSNNSISPNIRLPELDVLRATGILMIVFCHTSFGHVLLTYPLKSEISVTAAVRYAFPFWFFGLALFFFISGFALHHNQETLHTRAEVRDFLKKRATNLPSILDRHLCVYRSRLEECNISTMQNISTVPIQIAGAQGLFSINV
jgi:hypothetical protein